MGRILQKLKGGDLRSIGRAEEVVQDILNNPVLFAEVFEGMLDDDPLVRMRSADALEKVSLSHPEYLQPFKNRLISEVSQVRQQEVRWHVVQMFSYLEVDKVERDEIIRILLSYLDTDKSKIVKVCSMQSLANLGLLGNFVGMLTDSRSFLSYTRHEYFRRILCNLIGKWVENGEHPNDDEVLRRIVEGICYNNAARYFRL